MFKIISTKFLRIFFSLIVLEAFLFPTMVLAQVKSPPKTTPATSSTSITPKSTTPKSPATSTASQTIPSTWGCDELKAQIEASGGGRAAELPEYCNEGQVYNRIVYWLYYVIGIGAVIMLIYGGYIYMTAGSSEAQTKKGKNILMYTIIGVVVGVIATTIIRVVINLVVDNKIF